MAERIVYLDAGPIISIVCEEDLFHEATKAAMAAISGRMVTSYISILEALVVLRRLSSTDQGGPPGESMTDHLWNAVLDAAADVEIEVKSIRGLDLLDNAAASEVLTVLRASPTLTKSKRGRPWIRSVGVLDCFHLKAAESLGATQFLTTDRCLSAIETDMEMTLIGCYSGAVDIIRPALMQRRPNARCGETGLRNEEGLTC